MPDSWSAFAQLHSSEVQVSPSLAGSVLVAGVLHPVQTQMRSRIFALRVRGNSPLAHRSLARLAATSVPRRLAARLPSPLSFAPPALRLDGHVSAPVGGHGRPRLFSALSYPCACALLRFAHAASCEPARRRPCGAPVGTPRVLNRCGLAPAQRGSRWGASPAVTPTAAFEAGLSR